MDEFRTAVVVALGSSLPGRFAAPSAVLRAALAALSAAGAAPYAASRAWRSRAWPDPGDPPFWNAVALVETRRPPEDLLRGLKELEAAFGRAPSARNAARVLDLDLVAYGRRVLAAPQLVLPHPRAADRRFVMGPLGEIAPAWRHPVSGRSALHLSAAAPVGRDAVPEGAALFAVASGS